VVNVHRLLVRAPCSRVLLRKPVGRSGKLLLILVSTVILGFISGGTLGVVQLYLREASQEIRPLLLNYKILLLCWREPATELSSCSEMQSVPSHRILLTFILIIFSSMPRYFMCPFSLRFSDRNYTLILYCSIAEEMRLNGFPKTVVEFITTWNVQSSRLIHISGHVNHWYTAILLILS
jgi:hypothetical protein